MFVSSSATEKESKGTGVLGEEGLGQWNFSLNPCGNLSLYLIENAEPLFVLL